MSPFPLFKFLFVPLIGAAMFYIGFPVELLYFISVGCIILTMVVLFPLMTMRDTLLRINRSFAVKLLDRWSKDSQVQSLIVELFGISIIATGLLLLVKHHLVSYVFVAVWIYLLHSLIKHIKENYREDLQDVADYLQEDNNND